MIDANAMKPGDPIEPVPGYPALGGSMKYVGPSSLVGCFIASDGKRTMALTTAKWREATGSAADGSCQNGARILEILERAIRMDTTNETRAREAGKRLEAGAAMTPTDDERAMDPTAPIMPRYDQQEQRVWDAAFGASFALMTMTKDSGPKALTAHGVASEAVEGLRYAEGLKV